jgi:hypothetical protein
MMGQNLFPDIFYRVAAWVLIGLVAVAGIVLIALVGYLVVLFIGIAVTALALVSVPFLIAGLVARIAADRRLFCLVMGFLMLLLALTQVVLWDRHHTFVAPPASHPVI